MSVRNFKELIVWQKAMDLVAHVYEVTKLFPKEEVYGLTSQLRRAAVSVPSNIAEGQKRHSTPDFLRFLSMAQGSLAEVETQILIARRLGYLDDSAMNRATDCISEVGRLLSGLVRSLTTAH